MRTSIERSVITLYLREVYNYPLIIDYTKEFV